MGIVGRRSETRSRASDASTAERTVCRGRRSISSARPIADTRNQRQTALTPACACFQQTRGDERSLAHKSPGVRVVLRPTDRAPKPPTRDRGARLSSDRVLTFGWCCWLCWRLSSGGPSAPLRIQPVWGRTQCAARRGLQRLVYWDVVRWRPYVLARLLVVAAEEFLHAAI